MQLFVLVTVLSAAAAAAQAPKVKPKPPSPYGYGDWKPPICKAITRFVSEANEQSAATNFCSSYLRIPLRTTVRTVSMTATSTSTPAPSTTTFFATPVTSTVPSSTTLTVLTTITIPNPTLTITSTVVVPSVTTVSACVVPPTTAGSGAGSTTTTSAPPSRHRKRIAHPTAPKPGFLESYNAGDPLSSACRCFDILASTRTSLTTTTSTITSTAVAVTLTTTTTSTVFVSTLSSVTSSLTATTVSTVFTTSSSTTRLYARPTTPVQLFAQGGPGFDAQYNGQVLSSYNGTYFIPRTGAGSASGNDLIFTLFEITLEDQSLRSGASSTQDDPSFSEVWTSYLKINGFDYAEFKYPGNAIPCTMTTDPVTGYCPVVCADGDYDSFGQNDYQSVLYFNLVLDTSSYPRYNLFGVTPPSS